jgi:hypothetical protein
MIKTPSEKNQELECNLGKENKPIKIMFLKIPLSKIWRFICTRKW